MVYISKKGKYIKEGWKNFFKIEVPIKIFGLNSFCGFDFLSSHSNLYKTYLSQEMLKKGFLASNLIFVCIYTLKKL